MGIFGLFGGKKKAAATIEKPPCVHAALVARWDAAADIGIEAKATKYICDACHQEFTPEEAAEVRSAIKGKLIAQDVAEEA
jgi:hypothetical protein